MGKQCFHQVLIYLRAAAFSISIYITLAPIALVIYLYRLFVIIICQILRPELGSIVTGVDALFINPDNQKSSSIILTCFVVNNIVSEHRVREIFEQRVLRLKDLNGNLVYKRLCQYWVNVLGYSFWKTDDNFDLRNHVRKYDYNNCNLPIPTDEPALKLVLPKLVDLPWGRNKSHWEILIVDSYKLNYLSSETTSKKGSLIIFRFDHFLCDFSSIIGIFRTLFQSKFNTPALGRNDRALSFLQRTRLALTFPYEVFKQSPFNKKRKCICSRKARSNLIYDVSDNIPVSAIKSIKDTNDVDFASVIQSAVNASVCRCLQHNGKTPNTIDILSAFPVSKHPGGLCNYATTILEDFPLQFESSERRLHETSEVLKSISKNRGPITTFYLLQVLAFLPSTVINKLVSSTYKLRPSFFISIVPTTSSTEYFDGGEILDAFFVGTVIGNTGEQDTSKKSSNLKYG
ncbi:unnamed protein product [Allacma fusca]|uniref:O-acyltransferase WSD1 C-terminal domain-containing protein n=1 Tax=Allacma fusca TaxID=39272 RepID=A0A8J2K8X5_9HEXA|nr:unnamed protein product [Allacma fusca]